MSKPKHTPGPWTANKRSIRSTERAIASVHCPKEWPENHPTVLADAALIACAPELLEALKDARRWILQAIEDEGASIMPEKLAAIIAKAEGGSHE